MRLEIDKELCQGHGRCYSLFPQLFVADERGFGTVRNDVSPAAEEGDRVVQLCPESAISIVEGD